MAVLSDKVLALLKDDMKDAERTADAETAQNIIEDGVYCASFYASTSDGLVADTGEGFILYEYGADRYAAFLKRGEVTDTVTRLSEKTVEELRPYIGDTGFRYDYID